MRSCWWCAVATLSLVTACGAGWRREELSPPRQLPPRQQVQVWQEQKSQVLHAVVLDSESISGVPFHLPPGCDTCRVALARNTVDSMRVGNKERGALKSFGLGYVALALAAVVLYFSIDSD